MSEKYEVIRAEGYPIMLSRRVVDGSDFSAKEVATIAYITANDDITFDKVKERFSFEEIELKEILQLLLDKGVIGG